MDKETYGALKDILKPLKYSMESNDFSYFILNPNPVNDDIRRLASWIDEVAKEYNSPEADNEAMSY